MRCFLCILLAFSLFGQSRLRQAARDGRELSPDAIPELEAVIQVQPGDEEVRARLLGYYFRVVQREKAETPASVREARGRHVVWLIENTPRSELLSMAESFAMSGHMEDRENLEKARELWLQQVERYPHDLAVLRNAVFLLQQHDRLLVLDLMERAYQLSAVADRDASYFGTQIGVSLIGLGGNPDELRDRALQALDTISDPRVSGSAGATIVSHSRNSGRITITGETDTLARRLLTEALERAPDHAGARRWQFALDRMDGKVRPPAGAEPIPASINMGVSIRHRIRSSVPVYVRDDGSGRLPQAVPVNVEAAAREWTVSPTLVRGKAVKVTGRVEVEVARQP